MKNATLRRRVSVFVILLVTVYFSSVSSMSLAATDSASST